MGENFIPQDEDFYLLLKTICKSLIEYEKNVVDLNLDPTDEVCVRIKRELEASLQDELKRVNSVSELKKLIQQGSILETWEIVQNRLHELQAITCIHCHKQLSSAGCKQNHEDKCIDRRTCTACKLLFDTCQHMRLHKKTCPKIERKCKNCHKTFDHLNKLRGHEHYCLKRTIQHVKVYHCTKCDFLTESRGQLTRHITSQHGGSQSLQNFEPDLPDNPEFRQEYEVNRSHILAENRDERFGTVYNFPTSDLQEPNQLRNNLESIFDSQDNAFRINLSIGMILQDITDGSFRYFIPYSNDFVLPVNEVISNRRDLNRVISKFENLDMRYYVNTLRPKSSLKPFYVTNLAFYVYNTNYPLGCSNIALPEKLKRLKCIMCMESFNGRHYKDNLCFFRCLQYFRQKHLSSPGIHALFKQWCDFTGKACKKENFPGVMFHDLPRLEECFHICINVFHFEPESSNVYPKYLSRCRFQEVLNLNLFKHHLSIITNFKAYAKKFACEKCNRHFQNKSDLKRHQRKCQNNVKFKFKGGYKEKPKTIFEELSYFGIDVPYIMYDKFATYDFESILESVTPDPNSKCKFTTKHKAISVSINSNIPDFNHPKHILNENLEQLITHMITYLKEIAEHNAILMLKKFENVFEQLDKLIDKFSDFDRQKMNVVPDTDQCNVGFDFESSSEEEGEYDSDFIDETEYFTAYPNPYLDQTSKNNSIKNKVDRKPNRHVQNALINLRNSVLKFCKQLPVLGFNSSRYDLNLVKSKILKCLNMHKDKQAFVIKKCNAYLCISNEHFKFLDLSAYLAPGVSYAQFLKCYDIAEEKQFFPYEYLDCFEKLSESELPSVDAFYSKLKNCNTLGNTADEIENNYEKLKTFWVREKMNSLADLLKFYNDHDVIGLTKGIEKMQEKFIKENVSIFKETISISNYARRLLFKESEHVFPIFDENTKDIFKTIHSNIVGGPSIVFTRYMKTYESKIKNKYLAKSIQGLDANALYSWALSQKLPVGPFVDRRMENGFRANVSARHIHQYAWIDKLSFDMGIEFKHKLNNGGKEFKVGPYYVDGLSMTSRNGNKGIIAEFMGCFHHFHDKCQKLSSKPHVADRQQKARLHTEKRREYLKQEGYEIIEIWECYYITCVRKDCTEYINKYMPPHYQDYPYCELTERNLENAIINEELFGLVECDIELAPMYCRDDILGKHFFKDFPPIFCNTDVAFEDVGPTMQNYIKQNKLSTNPRRQLISGTSATKILLSTPLLLWYLNNGFIITKIYRVIEFNGAYCFKNLIEKKTNERRLGDIDPSKSILADTAKVVLNSFYGSLIMDKTKHRRISYIEGDHNLRLKVNDPAFINCTHLGEDLFEVETLKRNVVLDSCNYLAHFVLNYAKLFMIKFVYDVMHKYLYPKTWQYMEMDTDSIYAAYAGPSFVSCVRNELKKEFLSKIHNSCHLDHVDPSTGHWFPRECCDKHKKYDKRSPGLMKTEQTGDEMVCLSSKTYFLKDKNKFKMSCKGVMKCGIDDPHKIFLNVLKTKEAHEVVNVGFRPRFNSIYTYSQQKNGFNWLYTKRKILEDGINTEPLDIVLTPWKSYNSYLISYDCILHFEFQTSIMYHGVEFFCARQLFLYLCFMTILEVEQADYILNCNHSYKLKAISEPKIINSSEKISIMEEVLEVLLESEEFKETLKRTQTRKIFIAGDMFWGTGLSYRYALVCDPAEYPGANMLGEILMKLRLNL